MIGRECALRVVFTKRDGKEWITICLSSSCPLFVSKKGLLLFNAKAAGLWSRNPEGCGVWVKRGPVMYALTAEHLWSRPFISALLVEGVYKLEIGFAKEGPAYSEIGNS